MKGFSGTLNFITLLVCLVGYNFAQLSNKQQLVHTPIIEADEATSDEFLRSHVENNHLEGLSAPHDKMREVIANCSKQISHTFGLNQYEAVFNQNITAQFENQQGIFPPGSEVVLSSFCNAFTTAVDTFILTAQKVASMAPLGSFLAKYQVSGNTDQFPPPFVRNIAESLMKLRNEEFEKDQNRKMQEIESFISGAQNIIQQLGRNIGSMFGVGPFDAAIANSFLQGFIGTLGSNVNTPGVFTDSLNQFFNSQSVRLPQSAPEIPILSHLSNGLVN